MIFSILNQFIVFENKVEKDIKDIQNQKAEF